jgi:hypothetical protein
MQPPWKTVGRFLKKLKLKTELSFDPAIPLQPNCPSQMSA